MSVSATITSHRALHLPQCWAEKIERCVAALTRSLPVQEAILFGSCARGTATENSDIDLLVILPDGHGIEKPTLAAIRALSRERAKLRADVVVLSKTEWEQQKANPFGVYRDILDDGLVIYENQSK